MSSLRTRRERTFPLTEIKPSISDGLYNEGTTSDSWTINTDLDDVDVDLVFGRMTGGNAILSWNGVSMTAETLLLSILSGGTGAVRVGETGIFAGDTTQAGVSSNMDLLTTPNEYKFNGGAGALKFTITGAKAGDIDIWTAPSGTAGDNVETALVNVMTIKGDTGYVGIGTEANAVLAKLHVDIAHDSPLFALTSEGDGVKVIVNDVAGDVFGYIRTLGDVDILTANLTNAQVGLGVPDPSARVHFPAGTTAAGTAPLKLSSGPLLTIPEDGTLEYLSNVFYIRGDDSLSLPQVEAGEIRLTPKASSSGAEGTIFYDSDDDHVYVATE